MNHVIQELSFGDTMPASGLPANFQEGLFKPLASFCADFHLKK